MDRLRFIEYLIYGLVAYLPYIPLALYAFRGRRRYGKKASIIIIVVQLAMEMCNHMLVSYHLINPTLSTVLTAVLSLLGLVVLLKVKIGKIAMLFLIIQNFGILMLYLAKFTEGMLFYKNSLEMFRWSNTLCLLIWEIPFFFGIFRYMRRYVVQPVRNNHNAVVWRYLWFIPLTFFFIWNVYISQFGDYAALAYGERVAALTMLLVISAGSFVIYHITFLLLDEQVKNENYAQQYRLMNSRIGEARRARHDMRHHLVIIEQYLKDKRFDELEDYLAQYQASLPREEILSYCKHYVINALLTYTVQRMHMVQAECDIKVNYPENMPFSEQDLTILMGNLLENAVDACTRDKETNPDFDARMEVRGEYKNGQFLFQVKNTSLQQAKMDHKKKYISSKRSEGRSGIGIASAQDIARKCNGQLFIKQQDGEFAVSVII